MSTTAGVFSETLLLDAIVRADEMLFDSRIKQQYIPKYDALKAIMAIQNARVLMPLSSSKDFDVEIEWMNTCDFAVQDNESCVLGGVEASTNVEKYSLTYEKAVPFSVDESKYRDNRFDLEEGIAKSLLAADVALVNHLTSYVIAKLNTFVGQNELDGGKGTVSGTNTYIKPAYWNSELMAYFHRAARMNHFDAPILLSGHNLYEQVYVAAAKAGNADGKGDAVLFGSLPMYFDLDNVDTVNSEQVTYMIESGAVAFASKAYNPVIPETVPGVFTRYRMASKFIPELVYDVHYKPECSTGDTVKHNFKLKMKADIFLNPTGCQSMNTGVLLFTCGTPEP